MRCNYIEKEINIMIDRATYEKRLREAISLEESVNNIHDVSNQGDYETSMINGITIRRYGR